MQGWLRTTRCCTRHGFVNGQSLPNMRRSGPNSSSTRLMYGAIGHYRPVVGLASIETRYLCDIWHLSGTCKQQVSRLHGHKWRLAEVVADDAQIWDAFSKYRNMLQMTR